MPTIPLWFGRRDDDGGGGGDYGGGDGGGGGDDGDGDFVVMMIKTEFMTFFCFTSFNLLTSSSFVNWVCE